MTAAEYRQSIWKRYENEHDHLPASTREVAEWAVKQGLLGLPSIDPLDVLADQFSRSLREEKAFDETGKPYRVNHAVRYTRNGAQLTMWGIVGFAKPSHMVKSFTQRREQIIGDCFHLKRDVDAFNKMNPEQPPYQFVLDFTEDVAEREMFPKLEDEEGEDPYQYEED